MISLTLVLALIAFGVLAWGFERYRRRFVKTDLVIAGAISSGLITLAILPEIFTRIGEMINIQNRAFVIAFIANVVLLGLVLHFGGIVRELRGDLNELNRMVSLEQVPQTDGGQERIFIIIPAYNEEETIRSVVASLPESLRGYDVQPVVVSDGSSDDTAQEAKYNGTTVVELMLNQGQGGALQTGFDYAIENDASIVVTMDADGQHPVDALDDLVAPIINNEADYVMGSRYKGQNRSGNSQVREAGISFFTKLINFLTRADITDCTNGYRAIRGSSLEQMTLTEERFSAPELIIEARKNGLEIQEVPITILEREAGETKKPKLGYAVGLTRAIFFTWAR